MSPEQSQAHKDAVEKALEAARELDVIKKKLEEEKKTNAEKQKQENEGRSGCVILNFESTLCTKCHH